MKRKMIALMASAAAATGLLTVGVASASSVPQQAADLPDIVTELDPEEQDDEVGAAGVGRTVRYSWPNGTIAGTATFNDVSETVSVTDREADGWSVSAEFVWGGQGTKFLRVNDSNGATAPGGLANLEINEGVTGTLRICVELSGDRRCDERVAIVA